MLIHAILAWLNTVLVQRTPAITFDLLVRLTDSLAMTVVLQLWLYALYRRSEFHMI